MQPQNHIVSFKLKVTRPTVWNISKWKNKSLLTSLWDLYLTNQHLYSCTQLQFFSIFMIILSESGSMLSWISALCCTCCSFWVLWISYKMKQNLGRFCFPKKNRTLKFTNTPKSFTHKKITKIIKIFYCIYDHYDYKHSNFACSIQWYQVLLHSWNHKTKTDNCRADRLFFFALIHIEGLWKFVFGGSRICSHTDWFSVGSLD